MGGFIADKLTKDDYKVLITHYADILKHICTNFFGWDGKKDERGRHLLQYIGTDIVRKKDSNFWVDFMSKMLLMFDGFWDYVIIPDVRFPNEITALKLAGFDVMHIRIYRPEFSSDLTQDGLHHIS